MSIINVPLTVVKWIVKQLCVLAQLLYFLTNVWMLHTPNAAINMFFFYIYHQFLQDFDARKIKMRQHFMFLLVLLFLSENVFSPVFLGWYKLYSYSVSSKKSY